MEQDYESIFPVQTVYFATFWYRLAAAILDFLILFIPMCLVRFFFENKDEEGFLFISPHILSASLYINITIGWLYHAIQTSGKHEATFGKRNMNIKVTDTDGNRLTFLQASARHFGKFLSTLILFIGFFMMLWNKKRQTLHDKIADTYVVGR